MTELLNKTAPDFVLKDQEGASHRLSDYRGQFVILYFYPKDMTSGCTLEAQCFRDTMNDFRALNVQVLGISIDDEKSHKKFADKEKLNFPILSDTEKKVVKEYDVWNMFTANRESFLIDKNGTIIKHYLKVDPKTHTKDVLADIKHVNL